MTVFQQIDGGLAEDEHPVLIGRGAPVRENSAFFALDGCSLPQGERPCRDVEPQELFRGLLSRLDRHAARGLVAEVLTHDMALNDLGRPLLLEAIDALGRWLKDEHLTRPRRDEDDVSAALFDLVGAYSADEQICSAVREAVRGVEKRLSQFVCASMKALDYIEELSPCARTLADIVAASGNFMVPPWVVCSLHQRYADRRTLEPAFYLARRLVHEPQIQETLMDMVSIGPRPDENSHRSGIIFDFTGVGTRLFRDIGCGVALASTVIMRLAAESWGTAIHSGATWGLGVFCSLSVAFFTYDNYFAYPRRVGERVAPAWQALRILLEAGCEGRSLRMPDLFQAMRSSLADGIAELAHLAGGGELNSAAQARDFAGQVLARLGPDNRS